MKVQDNGTITADASSAPLGLPARANPVPCPHCGAPRPWHAGGCIGLADDMGRALEKLRLALRDIAYRGQDGATGQWCADRAKEALGMVPTRESKD